MRWQRRTPQVANEKTRMRHAELRVLMETGVGLASGQGSDPLIALRWSDDGGHTWSNEHTVSAGAMGQYSARANFRRLGQSRGRIYEVSGSDDVKIALIDGALRLEQGSR